MKDKRESTLLVWTNHDNIVLSRIIHGLDSSVYVFSIINDNNDYNHI